MSARDDGGPAQMRDPATGQYAYDGNWERMCVCGHTLGVHIAGGFECLAGCGCLDDPNPRGQFCDCKKFRQSRAKAARKGGAS